jgi:two-component system nitrate/nitrite response regulator NarL
MLTAYGDRPNLFAALAAGARGFLVKPVSLSECADGLLEIQAGGAPMCHATARWLVETFHADPVVWNADDITPAERAILICLWRGLQAKETAAELKGEISTVRTHLRRLYRKFQVADADEALGRVFGSNASATEKGP